MIDQFRRYYHTVRWLRASQIGYRVLFAMKRCADPHLAPILARRALKREPKLRLTRFDQAAVRVHTPSKTDWMPEDVIEGRFQFAHQVKTIDGAPDWLLDTPEERSWMYNLHYFSFAPKLAAEFLHRSEPRYLDCIKSLVRSWIAACPPGPSLPWDGGPLSHRIMNWCRTVILLQDTLETDTAFRTELLHSLFGQALYLERHIERHLCGNHVVTNGAALFFAGTLIEGSAPRRWRRLGLQLLTAELGEQVLPDGGHYERSPMYHCLVMQDYFDCIRLMRAANISRPAEWRPILCQMADFLSAIRHPDGGIPLLNDAAFGIADEPSTLLEEAGELLEWRPSPEAAPELAALPQTGYYLCRPHTGAFLIFDAGPVGPDHNPGHAHSDTLGFELSLAGRRILVDSGTYSYSADAWRAYCESTRAHNTVMIDNIEQTEKWGPAHFRVARRAKPADAEAYKQDGLLCLQASHVGYDHLPGRPQHTRSILLLLRRYWLIYDEILGAGVHDAESFLHFHPSLAVKENRDGFEANWDGLRILVQPFGCSHMQEWSSSEHPVQGWYCPEFGLRLAQPGVRLMACGTLPLHFGAVIAPEAKSCVLRLTKEEDYVVLEIAIDGNTMLLERKTGGQFRLRQED